MADLPPSFFEPTDDGVAATVLTRGPWDERFQHGGPPSALLAGAFERFGDDANDFVVARVAWEFRRPVPIGRLRIAVEAEHLGRTTQRLRGALLHDDIVVLEARGLRVRRRDDTPKASPPVDAWPAPENAETLTLSFFTHPVGYHRAVELRVAGGAWGATPIQLWVRPTVPLVAGRPTTALERLVTLADAQSGMGVPLDPLQWNFANPDLAVFVDRHPVGEWLGFDIRSSAAGPGVGLSQALIRDQTGACARSAQTLIISRRSGG